MAVTRGNLAYQKVAKPQEEEFDLVEFRRANSAFADYFFAEHNANSGKQSRDKSAAKDAELDYSFALKSEPANSSRKNKNRKMQRSLASEKPGPDFSFAKMKVESYYDDTYYDFYGGTSVEQDIFSENRKASQRAERDIDNLQLRTKFSRWLEKQERISLYEQDKFQLEMQERSIDERYLLVEEMGPSGFDTYETASYQSRTPRSYSLLEAKESAETLLRPSLISGNLALIAEPLDDQKLLEKLKERKAKEDAEKLERSAELKDLEEKINLRRLYRALGLKRLSALMTYLAMVLVVGGIFIGLLSRQANIVEANFEIAEKRSMINELRAKNHESYEAMMESYDLNDLRMKAMSELGLRPASQSQRIHIFLPEADRCILYSNEIGEKNLVKEDIIAFDYLNYQKLEHYFDGVAGIYD